MGKIELLAPAGSIEAFEEALQYGADAIYLGVGRFNARGDRAQLTQDDFPYLVSQARKYACKLYLTLNILFYDRELEEALDLATYARDCGFHAVIVQDRGLMLKLRERVQGIDIHASTQCTAGTKEAILAYKNLGCSRVVFPRELSLEEITELSAYAKSLQMETELFIHGALCFSVSGQCHMSTFLGGRSANRGDCAQACRKTYTLLQDGKEYREQQAWLSPKDLSTLPILEDILKTGVSSLKIEGRLRSHGYVGQTLAIYRNAIDEVNEDRPHARSLKERNEDLKIAFNRGEDFQHALLTLDRSQTFLSEKETSHIGLHVGTLVYKDAKNGEIYIKRNPKLSFGYLPEKGSHLTLRDQSGNTQASAPCGVIMNKNRFEFMAKGFHPEVLRQLDLPLEVFVTKQNNNADQVHYSPRKKPIKMTLFSYDEDIALRLDSDKHSVTVSAKDLESSPAILEHPLPRERVKSQLEKLGNTPYYADHIEICIDVPWRVGDLNQLRRLGMEKLMSIQHASNPRADYQKNISEEVLQYQGIIALPFWRGEPFSSVYRNKTLLFLIPVEEYLSISYENLEKIHASLSLNSAIGLLFPPLKLLNDRNEEKLRALNTQYVKAFAAGPSGLVKYIDTLGLSGKIMPISWQGNQFWNTRSYQALLEEGYTSVLLSPELEEEHSLDVIKHLNPGKKLAYWVYGRTESMFTRFCPVGFSQGNKGCRLCAHHRYHFVDNRERVFPLKPQRTLDCSFQVWQSEALHHCTFYTQKLKTSEVIPAFTFTEEDEKSIESLLNMVMV